MGVLLIVAVARDVFHTLWHPGGQGTLSGLVMSAVWRLGRRDVRGRLGAIAGPLGLGVVVALWGAAALVGWALVYLPRMPEGFAFDPGLSPQARSDVLDSLYLSLVTLGTLGYGDIVPADPWLRVLAPIQALSGFGLLTAAVSWALQVYPALTRRRALALRVSTLWHTQRNGVVPAYVLGSLAEALATVHVDMTQYSETYYFRDRDPRTALPLALRRLDAMAAVAQESGDDEVRRAGTTLSTGLDALADVLDSQYLRTGGSRGDVLAAYAVERGYGD